MENISGAQMIVGLLIGIFLLIILVLKTKVHAFLALIISAAVTGLVGGMDPLTLSKSISTGFGNTLASIGIVIGFGVMLGRILEVTGAAERMAYTFLKLFGKKKEEWALAATGYLVSIPIFCDSGYVILSPIAKALSKKTGKSIVTLGISLAIGLVATHHAVPPTPGPLGVAGIFKADVGQMILWGLVFALPVTLVGVFYAKRLGKKIYQIPSETGDMWIRPEKVDDNDKIEVLELFDETKMPSALKSFAPIVIPIILILFNTVLTALKVKGYYANFIIFLGQPIIAVAIGLLIGIYGLLNKFTVKQALKEMEIGIQSAGIIILVTGAGGALGQVLRDSGTGNYIAKLIAGYNLPAILLPFFVATFVRLIQGSGTVAMITSASITAPILANLNINPVFAAQSAALGAMVFSYFNDSFYWVVNRMIGIEDVKEQIKVWSIPTTLGWIVSLITLLLFNWVF